MANRHMEPGECHIGRRHDVKPVAISLDREASDLIREWAGGTGRRLGRYLSRLIYEERARREELSRSKKEAVVAE